MNLTKEQKDILASDVVRTMIHALEEQKLQLDDMSIIADFILQGIDSIQTQEQLAQFMGELAQRWPIFENISLVEKGKVEDKMEDRALEQVLTMTKNGDIEGALALAKQASQ